MATILLRVRSGKPGANEVTLIDGVVNTGYATVLAAPPDWGNAVWEKSYSGPRGTQGAQLAGAEPANRNVAVPLMVKGTSQDDLEAKLSVIWRLADEMRRYGGTITWRPEGGSYLQYFRVLDAGAQISEFGRLFYFNNMVTVVLGAICAPYLEGPPMDIFDDFSTDSIADYTFDTGAGTLSVSGGQLVPSSTVQKRLYHSARGYTYSDVQLTLRVAVSTAVNGIATGLIARRLDSANFLFCAAYGSAGAFVVEILRMDGGASTSLGAVSTGVGVTANGYWVRFRLEGNVLTVELFLSAPTPMGAPDGTKSVVLSGADATKFGAGISGNAGIYLDPPPTTWRFDDFTVEPYTYRNISHPEEISLRGDIPGDAPALADLVVTASGGSNAPQWAAFGWWSRPLPWNFLWNGDFEDDTNGWSTAVVASFANAATSITRITSQAKFGVASAQVVIPVTSADAGATFAIYRRFKKGVTYTAECWVRASSSTTSMRLALGTAADANSGAVAALSTTWTKKTITWTPTADREVAYVGVLTQTATATTHEIDGVAVYEGTVAPSLITQLEGRGGMPPFGVLDAESDDPGDRTSLSLGGAGTDRLGGRLNGTVPGSASTTWFVDPSLLAGDEYASGEVAVEVWARMMFDNSVTSALVGLAAYPAAGTNYGALRWSEESGAGGRFLVVSVSTGQAGFYRLGTIRLYGDRNKPSRWKLVVAVTTLGTGTFYLDHLLLLPANSRALSPSGKISGFPVFIASTAETTKRVRSDLSGMVAKPPANENADHGLGGSLIELPPGAVDVVFRLSGHIADTAPGSAGAGIDADAARTAALHLAVTPRWHLARS